MHNLVCVGDAWSMFPEKAFMQFSLLYKGLKGYWMIRFIIWKTHQKQLSWQVNKTSVIKVYEAYDN